MRSRILTTALSLFTVTGIALSITSCGGDDKPVNNDIPFNQEPGYQTVTAQTNACVTAALDLARNGFESIVVEGTDDLVYSPSLSNQLDSTVNSTYWRVIYASNLSSSVSSFAIDSLQYLQNDVVQTNFQNADAITLRHVSQQSALDTTVSYKAYVNSSQINITNLDSDVATVTGSAAMDLTDKFVAHDSTAVWTYEVDVTMSNLQVARTSGNWNYGCPTSGSITVTVNTTHQSTQYALSSASYTYTLTFVDGDATVAVTRAAQSASYTNQFCTVQ